MGGKSMIQIRSLIFSGFGILVLISFFGCGSSETKESKNENSSAMEKEVPNAKATKPVAAAETSALKSGTLTPLQSAIQNQNEEAIQKAATDNLLRSPSDVSSLNAMGNLALKRGTPLAAQFFFQKALVKDTNSSTLHNNLGLAYLAQKKEKDAVREFKKALECNARDPAPAGNLGAYYLSHRDAKRAYVYLDMGFKYSNHSVTWLANYGLASMWHGNAEQAEKLFKSALDSSPNDREVMYNLAVLKIIYQHQIKEGQDLIDRIKVMGVPESLRTSLNHLENEAKASVK
jgi:Tfp pilus assembly protein PilF